MWLPRHFFSFVSRCVQLPVKATLSQTLAARAGRQVASTEEVTLHLPNVQAPPSYPFAPKTGQKLLGLRGVPRRVAAKEGTEF